MIKKIVILTCFAVTCALKSAPEIEVTTLQSDYLSDSFLFSLINVSLQSGKIFATNLIHGSLKNPKLSIALSTLAMSLILVKKSGYLPITANDLSRLREKCNATINKHVQNFKAKTDEHIALRTQELAILMQNPSEKLSRIELNLTQVSQHMNSLPQEINRSQESALAENNNSLSQAIEMCKQTHQSFIQETMRHYSELLQIKKNELDKNLLNAQSLEHMLRENIGQSFQEISSCVDNHTTAQLQPLHLSFTNISLLHQSIAQLLEAMKHECSTSDPTNETLHKLCNEHEQFLKQFNTEKNA